MWDSCRKDVPFSRLRTRKKMSNATELGGCVTPECPEPSAGVLLAGAVSCPLSELGFLGQLRRSIWEQVAQRSCGCPLPGSVQGQAGWSSEQPGLVEDVPAHGRGVGTR